MAIIYAAKFIVTGRVQGVCFRKYTMAKAQQLGVVGFVKNEPDGTVTGECESTNNDMIQKFKEFLTNVGSPSSEIVSCTFQLEQREGQYRYNTFDIRH